MIVYPYYVVYVEVPSGHPGVGTFLSKNGDKKIVHKEIVETKVYKGKAILDILDGDYVRRGLA